MDRRTYLNVPYAEKDEAKALGAKWDDKQRRWYVPEEVPLARFDRWLDEEPSEREEVERFVLVPPLYVVEGHRACWKCGADTLVICLAASAAQSNRPRTRPLERFTPFSHLDELPTDLAHLLRERYPGFFRDASKMAGRSYYLNHCECRAVQGDFHLHDEVDSPFSPVSAAEASRLVLRELPVGREILIAGRQSEAGRKVIEQHARRVGW